MSSAASLVVLGRAAFQYGQRSTHSGDTYADEGHVLSKYETLNLIVADVLCNQIEIYGY